MDSNRKRKNREKMARWRAEHQDKYKAVLEEYKAKKAIYEEMPDEPRKKFYKTPEEQYCGGYDKNNLICIKCYENQTAQYKGCYKHEAN